jgi:cellulose synthase/poly-beta-1,6-N-acetylglucosamine synthase-like glycosyltransferase
MVILQFIFWVSVFIIFHTYLFYPIILLILKKGKKQNEIIFERNNNALPEVAILLAVHNEQTVIARKIESVYECDYPKDKIHFYIGSDNSSDKTDEIIRDYTKKYPNIHLSVFERSGKAKIINGLEAKVTQEVLILTDANVFFDRNTIYHLVKHYKNPDISLVGGNIINENFKESGISFQEKFYLDNEKLIKYYQGIIWGAMIGAFGGCYSIRKKYFAPLPENFFMDDFYISMNVLKKGGKTINELSAVCYEDVSNKISEEFRRKIRISIGNFQNLMTYKNLLWPPFNGLSFSFLSNKVFRWITPFLIIICVMTNVLLINKNEIYIYLLLLQLLLLIIPILDWLLKNININLKPFRFITHFYSMNLALLVGFFKFLTGVKSSVWKPTERNQ